MVISNLPHGEVRIFSIWKKFFSLMFVSVYSGTVTTQYQTLVCKGLWRPTGYKDSPLVSNMVFESEVPKCPVPSLF